MDQEAQTNQAETTAAEPVVGAEIPADAGATAPVEGQVAQTAPDGGNGEALADEGAVTPAEPVVVPTPENQPLEPASAEPAKQEETAAADPAKQPKARKTELASKYTYDVYIPGNERTAAFQISFLSRSSLAAKTALLLLKENVNEPEKHIIKLVSIELSSVVEVEG